MGFWESGSDAVLNCNLGLHRWPFRLRYRKPAPQNSSGGTRHWYRELWDTFGRAMIKL